MKKSIIIMMTLLLGTISTATYAEFLYKQVPNNTTETNETSKQNSPTNTNGTIRNTVGKNQDYIIAPSNNNNKKTFQKLIDKINDPYVIKINGTKYYMVKNANNGIYTLNNIVGYGDKKSSLFSTMKSLNSDKDTTKLTNEELHKANIRFVALQSGKLQLADKTKDFNDVIYIDLATTRESINNGAIGSFGYFDIYIKDKRGTTKKIIGYVSFDSDNELTEMMK